MLRWGLWVVDGVLVPFVELEQGKIFDGKYLNLLHACMDGH